MTTTVLSTTLGDYDVDVRHVHCHVRDSIPTSGDFLLGTVEWQVRNALGAVVAGTKLRGWLPEFSYPCEHGWTIHARYTDSANNKGAWVSTAPVSCDGDPAHTESPAANATAIASAVSALQSSLTAGEVGRIDVPGGTYDFGGAKAFVGGDAVQCRIDFVWDGSGAKPAFNNCAGFNVGKRGSFRIKGIDIGPPTAAHTARCFELGRSGGTAGDRSNYNVLIEDCDVADDFFRALSFDDLVVGASDRDVCRFVYLRNVSFGTTANAVVYGYSYPEYWGFWNVSWGDMENQQVWRVARLANSFFHDWTITQSTDSFSNWMRFIGGHEVGDGRMHSLTFSNCEWGLIDAGYRFEAPTESDILIEDIAFNNCFLDERGTISQAFTVQVDSSQNGSISSLKRWRWHNCKTMDGYTPTAVSQLPDGCYDDIVLTNCVGAGRDFTGYLVTLSDAPGKYADGCLTMYGCAWRWNGSSTGLMSLVRCYDFDQINDIDYCHLARAAGSGTYAMVRGSGATVLQSVDKNNSATSAEDFSWANVGGGAGGVEPTHGFLTFDPTLVDDDGPLSGAGWPQGGYSIDANGFLRDPTTPDAGPYEFGASTEPDDPVIGGGGVTMEPAALPGITLSSPGGTMGPGAEVVMVSAALPGIAMSGPDGTMGPGAGIVMSTAALPGITLSGPDGTMYPGEAPAGPSGNRLGNYNAPLYPSAQSASSVVRR